VGLNEDRSVSSAGIDEESSHSILTSRKRDAELVRAELENRGVEFCRYPPPEPPIPAAKFSS
jgi:hypothetical protein